MSNLRRSALLLLLPLTLGACQSDSSGRAVADASASEPSAAGETDAPWNSAPSRGVEVRDVADGLLVTTGPHAVVWPRESAMLAPPYTVRAVLHKQSGRIHEGYGLVFGGERLDAPEDQQAYSYFLIRGDGSFLIRRREGSLLPILRGWTTDRAILRDTDGVGHPNVLEVEVGVETTAFRVNGGEVARIPTAELRVAGIAGVRIAHDVTLKVSGFSAGSPAVEGTAG